MKKFVLSILMGIVLIGGLTIPTIDAEANTKAKVTLVTYKKCADLNKVYPGGVAKDTKVKNMGGKTKYKPFISAELYKLNSKSDRDKDGIACER